MCSKQFPTQLNVLQNNEKLRQSLIDISRPVEIEKFRAVLFQNVYIFIPPRRFHLERYITSFYTPRRSVDTSPPSRCCCRRNTGIKQKRISYRRSFHLLGHPSVRLCQLRLCPTPLLHLDVWRKVPPVDGCRTKRSRHKEGGWSSTFT